MIIKREQAEKIPKETEKSLAASRPIQQFNEAWDELDLPEPRVASGRKERRTDFGRQQDLREQEALLISRAQEEANAIKEAAAQEGYEEGLNQAQKEIAALQQAMVTFLNAKEEAYESAASEIGKIAVEIAQAIIKTEVACDETLVLKTVRDTLKRVSRDQKLVEIKVNAIDVKTVKEGLKESSPLSETVEVMVIEDDSIDPGSCMVETKAGMLDARFSTQIEILQRIILTGSAQ